MRKPRRRPREGVRLFRVGKITVVADASWFVALALVTWIYGLGLQTRSSPPPPEVAFALGLAGAAALFASVLVHEFAHSILSWRFGTPVHRIRLFVFGGVSELTEEPDRPLHEFLVAAAGPALSLLLGVLFGSLARLADPDAGPLFSDAARAGETAGLASFLRSLSQINYGLGIFNLLPAFPLDGGRCLRAILWALGRNLLVATRRSTQAAKGIAILLVVAGLASTLTAQAGLLGLWSAFVGLFLFGVASASWRHAALRHALQGLRVEDAMSRAPVCVPADLPLERAFADYLARLPYRSFPVVEDGAIVGLLALGDLRRIPPTDWASVPARAAAADHPAVLAKPLDPLHAAWARFGESGGDPLVVVDDGRLVGLVGPRDVRVALLARGVTSPGLADAGA